MYSDRKIIFDDFVAVCKVQVKANGALVYDVHKKRQYEGRGNKDEVNDIGPLWYFFLKLRNRPLTEKKNGRNADHIRNEIS